MLAQCEDAYFTAMSLHVKKLASHSLSPVIFSAIRDGQTENKTYNLENSSVLRRIFYSNQSACKKISEPFAITGDIFCHQGKPN